MNIKPAREAPAPAPFEVIDGVTRPVPSPDCLPVKPQLPPTRPETFYG
jgi:hypothetical protein